jgi:NAD-dependent deacetylase
MYKRVPSEHDLYFNLMARIWREANENISMKNIVILTGAGISAESGLGTFRDKDGIWTKYPLEVLATPEGFTRNPAFVHSFYNERRTQLKSAQAHAAHQALAKLEKRVLAAGGAFLLVTQNVDNLHEQAGSGSEHLVHMHGELAKSRCSLCGDVAFCDSNLSVETCCAVCEQAGGMRPAVVWFGEMPLEMDRIEAAVAACDVFVSIGTSGDVYPAAGYVQMAQHFGAWTVELNLEPSSNAHIFNDVSYGLASKIVPQWVDAFIVEHLNAD